MGRKRRGKEENGERKELHRVGRHHTNHSTSHRKSIAHVFTDL